MSITRVAAVYFSATGNSEKVVTAVAQRVSELFGCPLLTVNFTDAEARKKNYSFGPEDFVIVGSPTYAGKLPNKILPDFQACLKGSNTPAAAIVTFGNRSFDNSIAELVSVLSANGFVPVAGAAFACRHAFSDLLAPGRPNEDDLAAAVGFAEKAAAKTVDILDTDEGLAGAEALVVAGDAAAPYYVPKGTDGQPAKFLKAKPLTDTEKCTNCGECVKLCPVASIDPADVTNVPGVCIKCQACVRGCAAGAKYFDDAAFLSHVKMLEENFTAPKQNEFWY